RENHDGNRRMTSAQLGKQVEAAAVGQVQVEQDQAEIGVPLGEAQRLPRIDRLDDRRVLLQLLQHAAQRVPDQGVIVNDENLHAHSAFAPDSRTTFAHLAVSALI